MTNSAFVHSMVKYLLSITFFQTDDPPTFSPETAQVEIPMDRDEQRTKDTVPETGDAFVGQQLPTGKDPKDAKEEEQLGCCLP